MYTNECMVLDIVKNVLERFILFRTREMYYLTGNVILHIE